MLGDSFDVSNVLRDTHDSASWPGASSFWLSHRIQGLPRVAGVFVPRIEHPFVRVAHGHAKGPQPKPGACSVMSGGQERAGLFLQGGIFQAHTTSNDVLVPVHRRSQRHALCHRQ